MFTMKMYINSSKPLHQTTQFIILKIRTETVHGAARVSEAIVFLERVFFFFCKYFEREFKNS